MVFNIEVRECAMDVGTDLLACFRRPEDSDDWNLRGIFLLRLPRASGQLRVEVCGRPLIVVDTIKSDTEDIHTSS